MNKRTLRIKSGTIFKVIIGEKETTKNISIYNEGNFLIIYSENQKSIKIPLQNKRDD